MFLARLDLPKDRDAAALADELWRLYVPWRDRGRFFGDPRVVDAGEVLSVFASIPEKDALSTEKLDEESRRALADWESRGLPRPNCVVLGRNLEAPLACSCERSSAFVLLANFLSDAPPIRCLDCLGVAPFYRFEGWTRDDANAIGQWQATFRACDQLYIGSGVGERFGRDQLHRFASKLAAEGRAVTARIETLAERPAFYYIVDFRERTEAARMKRKCPGCGGKWLLGEPLHFFDYRCYDCRLLSSTGSTR